MYTRESYLDFLRQNKDREQVKVLTGLRGSGKTAILTAYMDWLRSEGVADGRILYYDCTDPDTEVLFPAENLYRTIYEKIIGGGRAYIFLDEIQALENFPQLVEHLFRLQGCDIVIAGSGLSGALSPLQKLLPGRCLVKEVFPLSFVEMASAMEGAADVSTLLDYTEGSAMPGVHDVRNPRRELDTIISAALFHEVTGNQSIRQGLLLKILGLISRDMGDLVTMDAIGKAAGRAGRPLLLKTLETYTHALEEAGLLLTLPLTAIEKADATENVQLPPHAQRFFFPDPAMMLLFGKGEEYPYRQLFTATAMEMRRRTAELACGRTKDGDIDLVTGTGAFRTLWQFIPNPEADYAEKKWKTLKSAPPIARKCVLTLAPQKLPEEKGIYVQHLFTWFVTGN